MQARKFAGLLLGVLLGISLLRSECQARAVAGSEEMKSSSSMRLIRQAVPANLSPAQKELISQFLPHLYAKELAEQRRKEKEKEIDSGSWLDFGRRSIENLNGDT